MDVQLLRCYDKAQDVDALYREILRNCKNRDWYWNNNYGGLWERWRSIDHLVIDNESGNYILCETNNTKWTVERWINLT
jgi:hypothetical protein